MDDCPRQDPAYRPAKGKPRFGGAFLYVDNPATRHGSSGSPTAISLGTARRGRPAVAQWLAGIASHRFVEGTNPHGPRSCFRAEAVSATETTLHRIAGSTSFAPQQ